MTTQLPAIADAASPPDTTKPHHVRASIAYREPRGNEATTLDLWQGYPTEGWGLALPHGFLFVADDSDDRTWSLYPWHAVAWVEYNTASAWASREQG